MRRLPLLAALVALVGSCTLPNASSDPMGDPIELGNACDETPTWSGSLADGIAPPVSGTDQFGQALDLYEDLCDRHVVIVRAGFD